MNIRTIAAKFIFCAYNTDRPLMMLLFRGMCIYLVTNILFSLLYWYSFISGQEMDFLYIQIAVDQRMPVKYLADTLPHTFFVTLPAALLWIVAEAIVTRKKLARSLPEMPVLKKDNAIRRIYTGELKSVLWPTKNTYIRVLIFCFGGGSIFFAMLYAFAPIFYDKAYNAPIPNMLFDMQAQDFQAFLGWNIFFMAIYQVAASVLVGYIAMSFQVVFQWKHIKRYTGIETPSE